LFHYRQHNSAAYAEHQIAGVFGEDEADIAAYRKILRRLADVALDEGESRSYLADLADEYDRMEDRSHGHG
jgi:hypothetical protein